MYHCFFIYSLILFRFGIDDESVLQLLREWPPGFGGVERVAHELASSWGGVVYSFSAVSVSLVQDPLPVSYSRRRLLSLKLFGRLWMPLPSRSMWRLLRSMTPLHGHLPSPGVLLVLVLARLMRPHRRITAIGIVFRAKLDLNGFFFLFINGLLCDRYPYLRRW